MAHAEANGIGLYGLVAEFEDPNTLVAASRRAVQEGYRRLDAYTPFPIEELHEALGIHHTWVPLIVLVSGLIGDASGFGLATWVSTVANDFNVGGRPYFSWPAFIPPTFETTVLFAAFGAVLGMLALNRLPMPYHPIFNVPRFALATRDRFFLCIEADDPKFDLDATRRFLESFNPREVTEVEA
jgi:hypothetical protein